MKQLFRGRALRLQILIPIFISADASVWIFGDSYANPITCRALRLHSQHQLKFRAIDLTSNIHASLSEYNLTMIRMSMKQTINSSFAEPIACNLSAHIVVHPNIQYHASCCSRCYAKQNAEPFACMEQCVCSRALRLQPHALFVCVSVFVCFGVEFESENSVLLWRAVLWRAAAGG